MIPVEPVQKENLISRAWAFWFTKADATVEAQRQSGATADRPTKNLWVGRRYMDTTLNKPVFYTAGGWRDATGALV